MNVLVTGATGFLGSRLCRELVDDGHRVRGLARNPPRAPLSDVEFVGGNITDPVAVSAAVRGMDAVVHLAARAHVMHDAAADPGAEYRRVNVDGTRLLLDAARRTGVSYFLFCSSVKAVGEVSTHAWNSRTIARPLDFYGVSKRDAELLVAEKLGQLASTTLRFPLVYGPGVRGNVLRLFDLIAKGWPVPVGTGANARSLLFLGNATAAIRRVLQESGASGARTPSGPFFVADGVATSTQRLVHEIANSLGVEPRTLPVPVRTLQRLARVSGLATTTRGQRALGIIGRLTASLEVDPNEFVDAFGFTPPFTMRSGLDETAAWYLSR